MAKSKKKKKKKKEVVDIGSESTVTILVPDAIADLNKKVLHGVGRLVAAAVSPYKVDEVAIIKSSEIAQGITAPAAWPKSVQNE